MLNENWRGIFDNKVAVVGAGVSKFGRFAHRTVGDIGRESVVEAIRDAGIDKSEIQAAYCGCARNGRITGQTILRDLGVTRIPVANFENACSSGATAFREACIAVGTGLYDTVLVVGVERLSKMGGGTLKMDRDDVEVCQGLVMPSLYAMRARRYMHDHGLTPEQLAMVSVKSRQNAVHNPCAQYRTPTTVEEVLAARPICEPLTLLMCCPTGDGSAAVVVTSREKAKRLGKTPVYVKASVLVSGYYETGFRDMTSPEISVRCAKEAYELAGMGPEDIDLAQVHDAFAISELFYCDALGFSKPGEAGRLIESGATAINGRIPVNTDGGLLSKGHPLGATGVSQIAETVHQLRGEAGARQVASPKTGLAHCTGGGVAGLDHGACTITILSL